MVEQKHMAGWTLEFVVIAAGAKMIAEPLTTTSQLL